MNLVVQGDALDPATLRLLKTLTGAETPEPIDAHAYRFSAKNREQITAEIAAICTAQKLDWAWVPEGRKLSGFGLFVTDMDSTLINIECIDEIADMRGVKPEVAAITESAMRGEIDYRTSLAQRVSLLAGLPEKALAEVYAKRLRLNPGAESLIASLKAAGIRTALVSGGFTYFTEHIQRELGFDYAWANELEVVNGYLTGRTLGPIIDGSAKADRLVATRNALGLSKEQVICCGDGANDIPMSRAAGFSIAYRPKPALREVAHCCFDYVGLEGIARLFG